MKVLPADAVLGLRLSPMSRLIRRLSTVAYVMNPDTLGSTISYDTASHRQASYPHGAPRTHGHAEPRVDAVS